MNLRNRLSYIVAEVFALDPEDSGILAEKIMRALPPEYAAAPATLAALEDLSNQSSYYAEKYALDIPSIKTARAAIAQATTAL